ncbi:MAG TPA: CehA/McbA family metallohydrolase [Polyangia bacterium]|nr:CehA/McbA family metallohydrolase [Polyangia bacterium]
MAAAPAAGCRRQGCLGGDDGQCLPAAACPTLRYTCDAPADSLRVEPFTPATLERASGSKAQAAVGDFLLVNDRVRVVLDAPEHPQGLAPSGGSIIDMSPVSAAGMSGGDQTNGVYQAAGVLPRDAVHYESWEVIDQRVAPPGAQPFVAVVFRGHLEGDRRVTVVTRYELRACEPGVRVRSDLYNGAPDPNTLYLADGLFWGDNTMLPFVPITGGGFRLPDLDLLKLWQAWRQWPFVAARTQAAPDVAFAVIPCNHSEGAGFNQTTLSAAGIPLRPTLAGDGISYERFVIAAAGQGLSPAVDGALVARAMIAGEPSPVTVTGRVLAAGTPVPANSEGRLGSLLFYEPAPGANPDLESGRRPWTEAVPGPDGRFSVALPPNRSYRIQPYAFGRPAGPAAAIAVGADNLDAGDLTIAPAARLQVTVQGDAGALARFAELILIPFDRPPTAPDALPSLYGIFGGCVPMLGPPHGGSPACNRALVVDGRADLLVPPGHYFVYATRGPFATLDRAEITLAAGDAASLTLTSRAIADLLPAGAVSGDFHVHGSGSYDSQIPDQDRVVSFLAAGINVIVASDHDVVSTYADTLAELGAPDGLTVIPGVEATPNILWFTVPGQTFPKTVGHFNFWPLTYAPTLSRNGAPWDELREPGALMDSMEPVYSKPSAAVRQLNHPASDTKLGRDQGFLHMIQYDPRTPVAAGQSFAADVLLRAPAGHRRNIDWDVQEVMTGASRRDWLRYRALWFSLLSQGFLRAGAANSDTHSLTLERVGYPRNIVFGGHDVGPLDLDAFDADVRAGHMVGTNGPVLKASIDDAAGQAHGPGLTPFAPGDDSQLRIEISAAPWIPVTQVRVFVNGRMVKTVDVSGSFAGLDHFGAVFGRTPVTLPVADLLAGVSGDAWMVVEAGMDQDIPPDDEDGISDGLPDLPEADVPTRPRTVTDPRFDLQAVAPGVWPAAFTNPFLLNRDGGAWTPPGLPK